MPKEQMPVLQSLLSPFAIRACNSLVIYSFALFTHLIFLVD